MFGVVLAVKRKRWLEILCGVVFLFLCVLALVGFFAGMGYFAWNISKNEPFLPGGEKAAREGEGKTKE